MGTIQVVGYCGGGGAAAAAAAGLFSIEVEDGDDHVKSLCF
jgi:hypothetical protein